MVTAMKELGSWGRDETVAGSRQYNPVRAQKGRSLQWAQDFSEKRPETGRAKVSPGQADNRGMRPEKQNPWSQEAGWVRAGVWDVMYTHVTRAWLRRLGGVIAVWTVAIESCYWSGMLSAGRGLLTVLHGSWAPWWTWRKLWCPPQENAPTHNVLHIISGSP